MKHLLEKGAELVETSAEPQAQGLKQNLNTLQARWDNIKTRTKDRKVSSQNWNNTDLFFLLWYLLSIYEQVIKTVDSFADNIIMIIPKIDWLSGAFEQAKLEDAVRQADNFYVDLNSFIAWLTHTEKTLNNLKPVSRVLDTINDQIEDHKELQKDISAHRETMVALDKTGTHLKYFSQKQDVILIKNLLASVTHRWERVASRCAERTKNLDHGYKEAKQVRKSYNCTNHRWKIITVNSFIFAALKFCVFSTFGLLRAFYFCTRRMHNIFLSKTKVEFWRSDQ